MRCDPQPFLIEAILSLWRRPVRPVVRPDLATELHALRREVVELRRALAVRVVHDENSDTYADEPAVKVAAEKVLNHVKREGGALAKSERGLAALIGAPRSTVRRAVHTLAMAGVVALEASRSGTVLRLVA